MPHIPHLEENDVRTGFLEREDYKKLRDLLPDYLRLLFVLGYHTGARLGELRRLKWSQVATAESFCIREPRRTRRGAGFPCMPTWVNGPACRATRKQYLNCPYLCHNEDEPLGDSCVKRAWTTAYKAAGVPGLHFHDLRRSAVRNMDRAGVPRPVAMRISGHKTESMYSQNNVVSDRDLVDVKEKMERYLSDAPEAKSEV